MKHIKKLGIAAIAATALMALAAGSASATTLEVGGVTKNSSVTISGELKSGSTVVLSRTDGTLANTCTSASGKGASVSPFTGTKVTGGVSERSVSGCSAGTPTIHQNGQIYVEHSSGTTNGSVFSENAEITAPTSLGFTVNCKTGEGTKMGTLTGTSSGQAIVHVNAVLNCGFLLPSASLITTLAGEELGISA